MIEISATVTTVPKLMTPEAERIWDRGVEAALDVWADEILGKAKELAPVNVGPLRNSLFVEKPEGRGVRFVTSPLPYAVVMEEGRTPGRRMPPFDPIALWVNRQMRIPRSDPRFESVVWLLRKKIAREGIRARRFFARAAEYGETKARELFDHMLASVAKQLERPA